MKPFMFSIEGLAILSGTSCSAERSPSSPARLISPMILPASPSSSSDGTHFSDALREANGYSRMSSRKGRVHITK